MAEPPRPTPRTPADARARGELPAIALEIARASGLGLARGKLLLPTPRLVALARSALESAKTIESLELVPDEGDARLHLVLRVMGTSTRLVVRAAVAALELRADGGVLGLRLLEAPTLASKDGGRATGVMGVLGAFGGAALASMGPERIVQTVAELIGRPLEASADRLTVDLGKVAAIRKIVQRPTPLGRLGDLIQVTGARFRPDGLELSLRVRPEAALASLRARFRR